MYFHSLAWRTISSSPYVSGAAFLLAALLWFTVPLALLHLHLSLQIDDLYRILLQFGAFMATLLVFGNAGLSRYRGATVRSKAASRVGWWTVIFGWGAYLGATVLVGLGALPVLGHLIPAAALAISCAIVLGIDLASFGTVGSGVVSWWSGLSLVAALLLGMVSLLFLILYRGTVAPGWTTILYLGLYGAIGMGWFLLGIDLLRRPDFLTR